MRTPFFTLEVEIPKPSDLIVINFEFSSGKAMSYQTTLKAQIWGEVPILVTLAPPPSFPLHTPPVTKNGCWLGTPKDTVECKNMFWGWPYRPPSSGSPRSSPFWKGSREVGRNKLKWKVDLKSAHIQHSFPKVPWMTQDRRTASCRRLHNLELTIILKVGYYLETVSTTVSKSRRDDVLSREDPLSMCFLVSCAALSCQTHQVVRTL